MADPARGRTVLVVEDDAAIRELLHLHLDLAGFAIEEAEDGRKALDRARSTPFDLVLLDVMLPGLDGVSVCRAIRNAGPNVDTPILMLTAREGESDKVLGLESGADDYLTKPFGVRELMARIAALMRRHGPAPCSCVQATRGKRHSAGDLGEQLQYRAGLRGMGKLRPTTNSRSASATHVREAVASTTVSIARLPRRLRAYFRT